MIRYLFVFIILFNFAFSLDLTNFDERQIILNEIKQIIIKEEQIAKAYEEYILENYAVPNIANLLISDFLGTNFLTNLDLTNFNTISINTTTVSSLSYALKSVLSDDNYLKNLYESDTFRKNTFFADGKINMIVEDDFAKELLYLITKQGSPILDCTIAGTKYCKNGDEIFIYDNLLRINFLMYFHKDKFKTGPIIITKDTTLQATNKEFEFIPKGALLYDEEGTKYIKTIDSVEKIR